MAARALSSLPTLGRLTISRVETRKQEIQGPRAINFPDFNFLPNGKLRKCIGGMAKRCGGDECFEMTLTWKLNKMRAIAQRSLPSKLCGNFPFGGSCYAPLHVLSIFRFNNLGKGFEIDCFVYVSHHGNSVYAYLQSMEGFSRFFLSLTTLAVNCCCASNFFHLARSLGMQGETSIHTWWFTLSRKVYFRLATHAKRLLAILRWTPMDVTENVTTGVN